MLCTISQGARASEANTSIYILLNISVTNEKASSHQHHTKKPEQQNADIEI